MLLTLKTKRKVVLSLQVLPSTSQLMNGWSGMLWMSWLFMNGVVATSQSCGLLQRQRTNMHVTWCVSPAVVYRLYSCRLWFMITVICCCLRAFKLCLNLLFCACPTVNASCIHILLFCMFRVSKQQRCPSAHSGNQPKSVASFDGNVQEFRGRTNDASNPER